MKPYERAARALCALDGNPENAAMDGKPLWQDYLPEVRAVIAALRDPSQAMIEAANGAAPGHVDMHDFIVEDMAAPVWSAMIDALLGEEPFTAAS